MLNIFILSSFVGNSIALVGSSSCGKSTDVSLIKRFYDTMILPWVMVITMYKCTCRMYNKLFVNVF
ncbi:putative ABC-type xenobiotic transporter [Helianthus anomalus]